LPLSHWIAFIVVGLYPLFSSQEVNRAAWTITVAALALFGIFYQTLKGYLSPEGAGFPGLYLLLLDAFLICFLIYFTGGISSAMFPLLFLLSATASLYDRWTAALVLAGAISLGYLAACLARGIDISFDGSHLFVNIAVLLGSSVILSYLAELDRKEHGKAERMQALYLISSELMENMDLGESLTRLVSSTASFLKTDISSLSIMDRQSGVLVLQASSSPRPEKKEEGLAPSDEFVNWIARERRPLIINGRGDIPKSAPSLPGDIRSILAAPIMLAGELVGVLCFASTEQRDFSQEDLQMLVTISNLAASVIVRAELYQIILSRSEVIVSSMSSGLLVTDSGGRVIMANQAARDLLGLERIPREASLRELLEPRLLDTERIWEYLEGEAEPSWENTHANLEVRLKGTPERILYIRLSPIQAGYEPNSGSVVIIDDITERVKVDEIRDDLMLLIARRVEEQTALYEVGRSLIDEVDTRNLLEFLLSKAVDLTDADWGVLSLTGPGDMLEIRAVYGLSGELIGMTYAPGQYLAGDSILKEEAVRRVDIEPATAAPWGEDVVENISYLAAPITWQGKTTGMIEVASPSHSHTFGEDDLRLLSLFVNQAAIALENSNLYRLITEDQRRMEAMLYSINDGVIAINNDAKIILANSAAESILNLPPFARINERHIKEVIRQTDLCNLFLKSLNTRQEMDEEIEMGPPDRKTLEVETSLIETSPGERIGIVAVIRDVTALRELEQAKSDFVSTVSHELRTPLTSIKAYVATLRRKDVDFDERTREEFLKVVEEEADRLTRLISDILDVSKIESGRLELKKRDFDMIKLLRIVTERMQSQTENHDIKLEAEEAAASVYGDPDKIEQVIMNLVDNAVKYSPDGGDITVSLSAGRRKLELSFKDSGVGIPEDHLATVFEKFHRVDNTATREIYGTGLGLYVSKSIIEAHGGTIWVESRMEKGSTFHFTLPLASKPTGEHGLEPVQAEEEAEGNEG
jgi:PAS domain S-box-containing protein